MVGIIGGLICFGVLWNMPVWAMFIGWGWYTVLGAHVGIFKQAIPSMLAGYLFSFVAIFINNLSGDNVFVLVAIVGLTVFLQMLSLQWEMFSCAIASFNAYSCLFAVYSTSSFHVLERTTTGDVLNIANALLWTALANFSGLLCGYISVRLSGDLKEDQ